MDKPTRNTLRNVVTRCRRLLEESIGEVLQGQYGIHASGQIEDAARMTHLSAEDQQYREQIVIHVQHIQAGGFKPKDAAAQLVREVAFTHLNRLVAYKLMETRGLIREAVSRGVKSQGFIFYLADHPADEQWWSGGKQDVAYRHFLLWLGASFADEIPALFSPHDSANRLFPPQRVLDEVLDLLNSADLNGIWGEDETIGWVYQYFTPKELRDQARKESAAPRNSYELAFRNQFYTPRYVVEFLTDNTLGHIWHEMRRGDTALREKCRYLVIRPEDDKVTGGQGDTVIGGQGDKAADSASSSFILHPSSFRPKKDPRDILMLDPAGGSGHFGLYCFDLFETIYAEAYDDPDLGPRLQKDYPDRAAYLRDVPRLILAHNLHIIDIDPRACQIAALALWLRAQRAYQAMGLRPADRPKITRSNIVCAEPMPGEQELLDEFIADLQPKFLGQMVQGVFDKMKLAGEAGSLLKIEDEISEAVAAAKKQWLAGPQPEQLSFFVTTQPSLRGTKQSPSVGPEIASQRPVREAGARQAKALAMTQFDLSGITDEEFWNEAETRMLEALRDYAEHATRGQLLRRQLFADDAAKGFDFIDVCRRRFDVALMNPPFGQTGPASKSYIEHAFPRTKNDLYAAFVERGLELLRPRGLLGAITSRTGFFLTSFRPWREDILIPKTHIHVMADLGDGVLDTAMVETAAYVPEKREEPVGEDRATTFFRILGAETESKEIRLAGQVQAVNVGRPLPDTFSVRPTEFKQIPGSPFAYWVQNSIRTLFTQLPILEAPNRHIALGLSTKDDRRFVRLWWEVNCDLVGHISKWGPYANGSAYKPFHCDHATVVLREDDFDEIKRNALNKYSYLGNNAGWIIHSENDYVSPGIGWPLRAHSFCPQALPTGFVFSARTYVLIADRVDLRWLLGFLSSSFVDYLLKLSLGRFGYPEFVTAIVRNLPIAEPKQELRATLAHLAESAYETMRQLDSMDETSHVFNVSPIVAYKRATLLKSSSELGNKKDDAMLNLHQIQHSIDQAVYETYGLSVEDRTRIDATKKSLEAVAESESECEEKSETESDELALSNSLAAHAQSLIMWCLGCDLGRWDVRLALDSTLLPNLQGPFDPLPRCSPGMLIGIDGLPTTSGHIVSEAWLRARPNAITLPPDGSVQRPTIADAEYPLRVDWDGILVDDADHPDDIVRRVRDVLDVLWPDRSEAIEREACDILEVKDLRDYFRKPGQGGFWLDHIKRYSKSRRKAPIYWLLQSSRKNYALWLYYHRLDKDLLYKALVNYVEPKIRLEDSRLTQFRAQKLSLGTGGREVKQLEKQIERQAAFVLELQDFHDKLRRAADLHLEPDLNDGVVLNIAPLWELVPWKEAQAYWEELLTGKYEWSSIGKQLKAKGYIQ